MSSEADRTVPPDRPAPTESDCTVPPTGGRQAAKPVPFGPGYLFGRYRIERKIGEGGMGTVYLATDTLLERDVALKIPIFTGNKQVAAERFLREARAAAGLQHPNICPIYDVGQVGDTHFLCMRFITGRPLSDRIAPNRPLDPAEAARIIRTVALAMQAAHAMGVIHRDLKPVNVMMDDRDEPVVMDFGLARRQRAAGDKPLTVHGDVMGTPAYMPPEQVCGDVAKMGPACDIYSLGVMLYELLVGEPPFEGDLFALVAQISMDPPKPPSSRRPGLDPRFDSVVMKALAKKPEERWKSMQAFADVLGSLAGAAAVGGVAFAAAAVGVGVAAMDGPPLSFKVTGTHFAYKPPPGLPVVRVGRQKRKPGEPPEVGNDFVLRVAGNDPLSARISRQHFEVHRTPAGYALVDKSKTGVTRNGERVPANTPVKLDDGDILGVADVVTLEVVIGTGHTTAARPAAVVEVPAPSGSGGGQVHIEASLGDMVTMDG
jgi:hypothetical protein